MKEVLLYRNKMAERGIELTPNEAAEMIDKVNNFVDFINSMSYSDVAALSNLSPDEREVVRSEVIVHSGFISSEDFDDLIQLIAENK